MVIFSIIDLLYVGTIVKVFGYPNDLISIIFSISNYHKFGQNCIQRSASTLSWRPKGANLGGA